MNKKQLIEEMAGCKVCYQGFGKCPIENKSPCMEYTNAENMYERGYRKVPDGAVILTPEERDAELKAYNEAKAEFEAQMAIERANYYNKGVEDGREDFEHLKQRNKELYEEINRLKADNEALKMWNEAYTEENEKLKNKNIKLLQVIKDFAKKHCNMKCKIAQRRVEDFVEYLRYSGRVSQGFDIIKQVGVREYRFFDEELDNALKEFLK